MKGLVFMCVEEVSLAEVWYKRSSGKACRRKRDTLQRPQGGGNLQRDLKSGGDFFVEDWGGGRQEATEKFWEQN